MVGGTSIGALMGGLYARDADNVAIFGRARQFATRMSSKWRQALDLTYPVAAWFTGEAFNRCVWQAFLHTEIEDLWLPYFCVTTNITHSRMEIHRRGYLWRYVRASMSLSGYLPPLCDEFGNMLLDGGYMNNLPADVMRALGAETIVAVDVAAVDDTSPMDYGDTLSGWRVLLRRLNPLSNQLRIPTLADIQSRLAYVSSVRQLEDAKRLRNCVYVRPPVSAYGLLDFDRFHEIFQVGYDYGRQCVAEWERDQRFRDLKLVTAHAASKHRRRASI